MLLAAPNFPKQLWPWWQSSARGRHKQAPAWEDPAPLSGSSRSARKTARQPDPEEVGDPPIQNITGNNSALYRCKCSVLDSQCGTYALFFAANGNCRCGGVGGWGGWNRQSTKIDLFISFETRWMSKHDTLLSHRAIIRPADDKSCRCSRSCSCIHFCFLCSND